MVFRVPPSCIIALGQDPGPASQGRFLGKHIGSLIAGRLSRSGAREVAACTSPVSSAGASSRGGALWTVLLQEAPGMNQSHRLSSGGLEGWRVAEGTMEERAVALEEIQENWRSQAGSAYLSLLRCFLIWVQQVRQPHLS